ncbi:hypothetical protein Aple_031280 [Acrocarpospora pleiomorpha]|uniref:Phospholipase D n=1 Tax=Acrocarpospora pleiomorpha TaxID=90975 RepID=A0A5M3XHL7_9ACTN|nr:hypothetical protein [Acrocarpospora pleiomorpha]GES20232.1 hypothetical protein Aple_031280 [Acrocarpospora pleiomorpha]
MKKHHMAVPAVAGVALTEAAAAAVPISVSNSAAACARGERAIGRRRSRPSRRAAGFVVALCAFAAACFVGVPTASAAGQRPIYAIAHRVNTLDGVSAAIKHGANAIEIDVCAWWNPNEWRAWHDCSTAGNNRLGPSIDSIFDKIVSEAWAGRRLSLIWLDIKDPNYCGEQQNRTCSVAGLRDKAQRLVAAGIQVLYGFYEYHAGSDPDVGGRGWRSLQGRLGPLEGITTTGSLSSVQNTYATHGSGLPNGHRLMDYGDSDIRSGFGNCTEASWYTCAELKKAAQARDAGAFAATFSWTIDYNDTWYVGKLLGEARVDGIIAGWAKNQVTEYNDGWECAQSIAAIRTWVSQHSSTHRMATPSDRLFR